jgi:DnaJ homolog subfamily C member 19
LNVTSDADLAAINAAHHHLIQIVHPDKGGSAELAARVNMARDILTQRLVR